MRGRLAWILLVMSAAALAAPGPHAIAFGKWVTVKWSADTAENKPLEMKVRPLYVDDRLREYTLGESHEITDRLFVVQQAYRLNDVLPGERGPRWKWQRGGWLMVERSSGRVRRLSLPEFDASHSQASWYRDYAAYCGSSEEDGKRYAVVAQLGRRKPLLRQELGAECAAPAWQRSPARVTFETAGGEKRTYEVRGHAVDPAPDEEPKGDENP
ncbi:MAG: hypothetical protein ACRD3A_12330 [Terriglobales bacterium]